MQQSGVMSSLRSKDETSDYLLSHDCSTNASTACYQWQIYHGRKDPREFWHPAELASD